MYPKKVARDTAKTLQNYLTYQAVKIIVEQLGETNPGEAIWLSQYSSGKLQDGEAYIEGLMQQRKELVLRILVVRQELAEAVADFLPQMLRSGISESNTAHRRQLLERLTQTPEIVSTDIKEASEPDTDGSESSD